MYQFSRAIYRELAPLVHGDRTVGGAITARRRLLEACEATIERLATDRHYFAHPTRFLFEEVRTLFPLHEQSHVWRVIERHLRLATAYVEEHWREGVTFDGSPLRCHASTRKGTPCQRVPLPGRRYCPSHKHLEERFEAAAAA